MPADLNSLMLGGAFDPARLFANGEAGAWYDPSDASTLWLDVAGTTPVTTDGQTVARMDDKSGNGRHLVQSVNSAFRPTWQESDGVRWLQFDGSNDYLVTSSTGTPIMDGTSFMAAASSNANSEILGVPFTEGYTDADIRRVLVGHDTRATNRRLAIYSPDTTFRAVDFDAEQDGTPIISSFESDSSSGVGYRNNVVQGSSITTTGTFPANTHFYVGAAPNGGTLTFYLSGNVYGALIIDRELTNGEKLGLNSYYERKMRI